MLPFHSWILHYHYASIRLEKKRLKIIKNRYSIGQPNQSITAADTTLTLMRHTYLEEKISDTSDNHFSKTIFHSYVIDFSKSTKCQFFSL